MNQEKSLEKSELDIAKEQISKLSTQVKRLTKTESALYDAQEMLDKQIKIYSELYELGKRLSLTHDLKEILDSAVHFVLYELDFERSLIFIYDEESLEFKLNSFDGYYEAEETDSFENFVISLEDNFIQTVINSDSNIIYKPSVNNDLLGNFASKIFLDEYIVYILGNKTKLLGLMVVGNSAQNCEYQTRVEEKNYFIVGLNNLISQITNAINNVYFYTELEKEKVILEDKVADAVITNRKKDKQIYEQSKMASMGDMIGNIAHQWRQPLSAITATASSVKLSNELGILETSDISKQMDTITNKANHLSETINTFRDFIKEKKELKEVVLQDRIDNSIHIVEATLKDNHIRIINEIDYNEPIYITVVIGELPQVLINILNNAKDIMSEKNIIDRWVKIAILKTDLTVTITIEDNGGGIPENIIDHIFEPYFTTKHQSQGTGLGLHMSQKIIRESLNGKLYVENTKNGAKFYIQLPLD
ncbi:MAG: GAF domain-containing sensor histidine kinase [Campylobacterota bacterium]|nr:GAF domain-containing sensor histidine kinase [Campylobacterota bacterium]